MDCRSEHRQGLGPGLRSGLWLGLADPAPFHEALLGPIPKGAEGRGRASVELNKPAAACMMTIILGFNGMVCQVYTCGRVNAKQLGEAENQRWIRVMVNQFIVRKGPG